MNKLWIYESKGIELSCEQKRILRQEGIFFIPSDVMSYPRLLSVYFGMVIDRHYRPSHKASIIQGALQKLDIWAEVSFSPPMYNENWIYTLDGNIFYTEPLSQVEQGLAIGNVEGGYRLPRDFFDYMGTFLEIRPPSYGSFYD